MSSHLLAVTATVPPRHNYLRARRVLQHLRRRFEQLSNPFAVDESPTVENRNCVSANSRIRSVTRHWSICNAIPDDTNSGMRGGAIVAYQMMFIWRKRDHPIGCLDQIGLNFPLSQAFGRAKANFIFRPVEGMNRINDWRPHEFTNRKRHMCQPKHMHMHDVRPPYFCKLDGIRNRRLMRHASNQHAATVSNNELVAPYELMCRRNIGRG